MATGGGQRSCWRTRLAVCCLVATAAAACTSAAAREAETARLAELLELGPGSRLADVGAGEGDWSAALLPYLEPGGFLWATEVAADKVEELRERLEATGSASFEVVLGSDTELGLPAACCDAILLRLVYHHFTEPGPMRVGLKRALVPGGLMAVVDIVPQAGWRELPGVPDRGGHGLAEADLVAELTGDGFEVVSRHGDWNGDADRYCVVFRAPAAPPGASGTAAAPGKR